MGGIQQDCKAVCNISYQVLWNAVSDGQWAAFSKTVRRSATFRIKFAHTFIIKANDKFKQHNNDVTMLALLRSGHTERGLPQRPAVSVRCSRLNPPVHGRIQSPLTCIIV